MGTKRCFRICCSGSAQIIGNALGFFTVAIACLLISDVIFVYSHYVLPVITRPGSPLYFVLLTFMAWVSFGVFFNYFGALGVNPGFVPRTYTPGYDEPERMCHSCNGYKAPRSHHCFLCGRCVMKMDHHCPWINTCVGYHNQRYFTLFLTYLLVGTLYTGLGFGCVYWDRCVDPKDYRVVILRESTVLLFSVILVIALFLAMCGFVGWNTYMILTNQTSIEYQINSSDRADSIRRYGVYRSPYDLGRLRNLKEVFGAGDSRTDKTCNHTVFDAINSGNGVIGLIAMFHPTIQPMPSDGMTYTTFESYIV